MNNNNDTSAAQNKLKLKFAIPDLQTLITLFYISIVVVGMIFNSTYYGRFGINIFDYSDILDFLVAPLGDLKILFFTALTLLTLYLLFRLDRKTRVKYPKLYKMMYAGMTEKSWFDFVYYIQYLVFIPIYLIGFSSVYASFQKKKILKSEDKIEIVFNDGTTTSGKKIGANSSFHFLLESDEKVKIIPNSSVKSIIANLKKKTN